jgi:signal transduction histidine kinase
MLSKDEQRILNITRVVPVLVLLISIVLIVFITEKNNKILESDIGEMKEESLQGHKQQIKNEITRAHQFIIEERKQTISSLKLNIKSRVNEAYDIAKSIYEKNLTKKPKEIKKMINDALVDIRFNEGRGYFFIYKVDGTSILHPILPQLENTNLWDLQDVKGMYVTREFSSIITNRGEGFLTWWWSKPNRQNIETEFEKIGYAKHFEPYDWFIGTGEYVTDFESDLKERLLIHINNITLGENGYIFVIDNQGTYLTHYVDDYIGKNRLNRLDSNGLAVTKEIINVAKSGEGYLSYVGSVKPSTGLPAEKISYIKGYPDFGWAIGTGVYVSEINETIYQKQDDLRKKSKQELIQTITISVIVCVPLFLLSILLSNQIKSRFENYKKNVETKSNELKKLNKHLEDTVVHRTEKLQNTIVDLKETQEKLVETEKMASMMGLVSGVAHEMNTPFGIAITALSQTEESVANLLNLLKAQKLTKKDLAHFEEFSQLSYELINRNMQKAINLIDSFKSLSPQEQIEDKKKFHLVDAINQSVSVNQELLDDKKIKVSTDLPSTIEMDSYFHTVFDIINQLIQNSIIHAFNAQETDMKKGRENNNQISISSVKNDSYVSIEYQDNGQGIKEENKEKIFEPFYTTKRNTNCTGLGMSILYNRVVHQLKGELVFNDQSTSGFKLTIKLPLVSRINDY